MSGKMLILNVTRVWSPYNFVGFLSLIFTLRKGLFQNQKGLENFETFQNSSLISNSARPDRSPI